MRVKGWVNKHCTGLFESNLNRNPHYVHVEEIPADAVRCEAVVYKISVVTAKERGKGTVEEIGGIDLDVPNHLIGKKVSVIIMEETE